MICLSSKLVCELSNLSMRQMDDWTRKGIIAPHSGGTVKGDRRLWSQMQSLGIAVASEIRNSDRGCVLSFVGEVFEAFSSVDEAWLQQQFSKGNTHFVMVHYDLPLLRPAEIPSWVDVQRIFESIKHAAGEVPYAS